VWASAAGIFGNDAPAAVPARQVGVSASSLEGGIFGAAPERPTTASRESVTKSGIVGGIFGGGAYAADESEPLRSHRTAKPEIDASRVAGMAQKESEHVASIFGGEAAMPLAPLTSARANPNASSVEGGIFGQTPTMVKPAIARHNPNASSIEGGIFG
jgi:hypothetical protein